MRKDRTPPPLSVVLSLFGGGSIIVAILFFGASFYIENEIGRAFCLGAFFSGLLGAIVLFGFAKVISMLDTIRATSQTSSQSATSAAKPSQDPDHHTASAPPPSSARSEATEGSP